MAKMNKQQQGEIYDPRVIAKRTQTLQEHFKPPYRLALIDGESVSVFDQVEHTDLKVMAGLVAELNSGGKGKRNRKWLIVDSEGLYHTLSSLAGLKMIALAELRDRNRMYRIMYADTGRHGYVGPTAEPGQITDPSAIRIMQSQLFAKVKTGGVRYRFAPRFENGKIKPSTHRF